ncbi:hypothetical protein HY992_03040 [Candidatus Micrarchaeota archaeon]|nr:hypothetical protein [Candidatus Micrarchaeota archaeon]
MAIDESLISTGVDNLIKLVYARGRVKLQEASNVLSISPSVVEEWSKVLEEEGIIRLEYLLTGVFLVWSGTPAEETIEKKEVTQERSSITREIEAMIQRLRTEDSDLTRARDELTRLPELLDQRLSTARAKIERAHQLEKENERARTQSIQAVDKLKQEIEKLRSQLLTAEAENKEFTLKTASTNEQLDKLKEQALQLRKNAQETSEKIKKLEELGGKFTEIRQMIAEHNSQLSKIASETKKAEDACKRMEELKNSFTRSTKDAEAKIQLLQKKCVETMNEMEETEKRFSKEAGENRKEAERMVKEAEDIIARSSLKNKEKEVATLMRAIDEAREEQQKLMQRMSMLSMEARAIPAKPASTEMAQVEAKTEKIKKKLTGMKKEEDAYADKKKELIDLIRKMGDEKPAQ